MVIVRKIRRGENADCFDYQHGELGLHHSMISIEGFCRAFKINVQEVLNLGLLEAREF